MKRIKFIGMDVDRHNIDLAVFDREQEDAISVKRIPNQIKKIREEFRRQEQGGFQVVCCYEAGPCGFSLYREITELGYECRIVSPELIPKRPSDKVKTNRKDAILLGRMMRAGELSYIYVLTAEGESVRDMIRLREDLRTDILRTRQRLSKFLLRQGYVYEGKAWTKAHEEWMNGLKWEYEGTKKTFEEYRWYLERLEGQRRGCDQWIEERAEEERWRKGVGLLRCFRGIDTLTAMALLSEIEDFSRFPEARSFMNYV